VEPSKIWRGRYYYLTPTAIYVLIKIFHRDIANSMKRDYVGPFPGVSAYIAAVHAIICCFYSWR